MPFADPRRTRAVMRAQACAWLARMDAGLAEEELDELDAWFAESPEHAKVLLATAKLWDQMSVLSELSHLLPLEQFALERSRAASRSTRSRRSLATAAVVLVAVAAAASAWLGLHDSSAPSAGSAVPAYATEIGEQLSVPLPDGSEAVLNTDTSLEVIYSEEERTIVLERGEVYFDVAPDAKRPFRVRAGARIVEAVGTAFTLQRTRPDSLEVTVVEGRVSVLRAIDVSPPASARRLPEPGSEHADSATFSLAAGEVAIVSEQEDSVQKVEIGPEDIEARLAWRHGMLFFQGDSLETVIREVSRYSTVTIEAEPAVRDIPVNGYIRAGDIEQLVALLQQDDFELDVQRIDEDYIRLSADEPEDE